MCYLGRVHGSYRCVRRLQPEEKKVKFRIMITAVIDAPPDDLKEELELEKDDDIADALQQHLNDNLVDLGIEAGETEIGAVEVTITEL